MAVKEAAIRHAPLTVLTVHETLRGYYGGATLYPDDPARTEAARKAAQAETEKVLAGLDEPARRRSRSRRSTDSRPTSSSTRARTPTCWSWAHAARAASVG